MRTRWLATISGVLLATVVGASEHEHEKELPAGPIRDRHELMERIGKDAKVIGDALKSGDFAPIPKAAEAIRLAAAQVAPLFPAVSMHPNSRAKEEIWSSWPKFVDGLKHLEAAAGNLAAAATTSTDVAIRGKELFGVCKSCHDQFRVPDKD